MSKELTYAEALGMAFKYSTVSCANSDNCPIDHKLTELEVYEGETLCSCCKEA